MCLILLAYQSHPDYPLIVAANRDEFYERPTRGAHFWDDQPDIFAGRDLQAGGTWMGISKHGRFAAVTNYREPRDAPAAAISRGELCSRFLNTDISIEDYLLSLDEQRDAFAGFNLLTGNFENPEKPQLGYFSNRKPTPTPQLETGLHGLSNGLLNEPWPKVSGGLQALTKSLHQHPEQIHPILLNHTTAAADQLPDTGIEKSLEEKLSSRFINIEGYGTRSSTVIRVSNRGTVEWLEQSFDQNGPISTQRLFTFDFHPPIR